MAHYEKRRRRIDDEYDIEDPSSYRLPEDDDDRIVKRHRTVCQDGYDSEEENPVDSKVDDKTKDPADYSADYRIVDRAGDITEDEADDEADEESQEGIGEDAETKPVKPKRPSPIMLMLFMMINPVEGWKRIRRSKLKPEEVASGCFYPLTALASASVFIQLLYGNNDNVTELVVQALTVFISFFFGYFLVSLLEKNLLPKSCREKAESPFGREFVMYLMSTLTLFFTLATLLPMIWEICVFLPLWTVYLASKGVRFFKFEERRINLVTALICIFVVAAPIAIYMIFSDILMAI